MRNANGDSMSGSSTSTINISETLTTTTKRFNFQWQGYAYTHYLYVQNGTNKKKTIEGASESSSISHVSALNEIQAECLCVCMCAYCHTHPHTLWGPCLFACWCACERVESMCVGEWRELFNNKDRWVLLLMHGVPWFFFFRLTDAFAYVCVWYLLSLSLPPSPPLSSSLRCFIKCLGNKCCEVNCNIFQQQ